MSSIPRPGPLLFLGVQQMGVSSKNLWENTLKWMVKIMEIPIKIEDLGGFPTIFGNTQICTEKWELSLEV